MTGGDDGRAGDLRQVLAGRGVFVSLEQAQRAAERLGALRSGLDGVGLDLHSHLVEPWPTVNWDQE